MKVYVFTYHQAVDDEFLGVTNKVFDTREKAISALYKWRRDELEYVMRDEWEITVDTDDHFEACNDGVYCTNHTEGFVNEYEVL